VVVRGRPVASRGTGLGRPGRRRATGRPSGRGRPGSWPRTAAASAGAGGGQRRSIVTS